MRRDCLLVWWNDASKSRTCSQPLKRLCSCEGEQRASDDSCGDYFGEHVDCGESFVFAEKDRSVFGRGNAMPFEGFFIAGVVCRSRLTHYRWSYVQYRQAHKVKIFRPIAAGVCSLVEVAYPYISQIAQDYSNRL